MRSLEVGDLAFLNTQNTLSSRFNVPSTRTNLILTKLFPPAATKTNTNKMSSIRFQEEDELIKCEKSSMNHMRPRSRAIAIKHSSMDADSDSSGDAMMYDLATWRMYNLIQDHRRNQEFTVTGTPVSSSSTQRGVVEIGRIFHTSAPQAPSMTASDVGLYDGEVFELEM
jgi:hypothetical protein